uniref:Uncharacterized protein n=1 Tax=Anguilla anguilla TaxID=7936 RepID=A0A0E9SN57_ANGAN
MLRESQHSSGVWLDCVSWFLSVQCY